jgi:hypothetical protein
MKSQQIPRGDQRRIRDQKDLLRFIFLLLILLLIAE